MAQVKGAALQPTCALRYLRTLLCPWERLRSDPMMDMAGLASLCTWTNGRHSDQTTTAKHISIKFDTWAIWRG